MGMTEPNLPTLRDVTFITVAYGSVKVLPGLWETLPIGSRLIIIDDGPADGREAWASVRNIVYKKMHTNVGFGSACNEGAKLAKSEWLFFVNPDVRLFEDSFDQFMRGISLHPQALGFGPVLVNSAGEQHFKRHGRLPNIRISNNAPKGDLIVPFLSGAALVIKRSAFETVNGFDPKIFLYFEDDDLCHRISQLPGTLVLLAECRVTHLGGKASLGIDDLDKFKEFHYGRSETQVLAKHLGRNRALLNLLISAIKLLNPRTIVNRQRRTVRLARLSGVTTALRDN